MSQDNLVSDDEEISGQFSLEQLLQACKEEGIEIGNAAMEVNEEEDGASGCREKQLSNDISPSQEKFLGLAEETEEIKLARMQNLQASEALSPVERYHEHNQGFKTSKKRRAVTRVLNYKKRMHGEAYVGFDSVRGDNGRRTTPQTKARDERKMGPPCSSKLCLKRGTRNCQQFSNQDRKDIFSQFWKMSWDEKSTYVTSLVDGRDAKHRKPNQNGKHRKEDTYLYYLKLDGLRKQVCRNMFLSTLGIGRAQVRGWLTRPKSTRTRQSPSTVKGGDTAFAREFLELLPKLPSHYCRKDTSKLYLEPIITTKHQLFRMYKSKCNESDDAKPKKTPVSLWQFNKIFKDQNLAIHQPKKDRCDTCSSYDVGLLPQSEYLDHLEDKEGAREEKRRDKCDAIVGKCHVIAVDMQAVLLSPVTNASALYYKTKLIVHNYTIFNLGTKHAKCFLWDETEGELVASVFATCLLAYLKDNFKDNLPIVIYSDGCTNQNRNAVLSNALSHFAIEESKTIIQKYLTKGHTQMEVDSVHANIEKSLKGRWIYSPMDYLRICEEARHCPAAYEVEYMNYKKFLDYSDGKTMRYSSIRPGNKTGDSHVTDLRQIKYKSDGSIEYKLVHKGEWLPLPRKPKTVTPGKFQALYKDKLPLPKRKYQDLKDLLRVIPENYHSFYLNLPYKK